MVLLFLRGEFSRRSVFPFLLEQVLGIGSLSGWCRSLSSGDGYRTAFVQSSGDDCAMVLHVGFGGVPRGGGDPYGRRGNFFYRHDPWF